MKICTKCKMEKDFSEFGKNKKSKDGLRYDCRTCRTEYYHNNLESINEARQIYNLVNSDKIKQKRKEHYQKNATSMSERNKKYRELQREELIKYNKENYRNNDDQFKEDRIEYCRKNADYIREWKKEYESNNKEKIALMRKKYRSKNADYIRVQMRTYFRERRQTDPLFKLLTNIRRLITLSLNNNGFKKDTKTNIILGCTYEEFFRYLNDNIYGFKYEDGIYDIDHIIPTSTSNTEDEIIKLNHYTNLQLLPRDYNRNIKKNSVWDSQHFEEWLNGNPK